MHTIQSSHGRHNIFSETDHDRKQIESASSKGKIHKKVGFALAGEVPVITNSSSPNNNSTKLPDIDLNVRKKLASNDLQVKFSHKSNVLTVASTLSKKETSGPTSGNTLEMDVDSLNNNNDDLELISTKSNYSDNLEVLKYEMSQASNGNSPLTSPSRSVVGPFSPATILEGQSYLEHGDGDWKQIDEYDDEDHGKFGSVIEEHTHSRTDPKQYKSTLDAHQSFMNTAKSKSSMKYMKSLGSSKTLPSSEMIEESKKARSILESSSLSPTKSGNSTTQLLSPAKSPNQLKPLTTSFMFLTALTKGKVPKLAREEKEQQEVQSPSQPLQSTKTQNTFTTDDITYGIDENKALSPLLSPIKDNHFTAPLDRTSSPTLQLNLSTKTYSRFGSSKNLSASTLLRSVKSMETRSSNNLIASPGKGEEKKSPVPSEGELTTFEKLQKLVESPNYEPAAHLYDIPKLAVLNDDKRALLKGVDNVVNNLTFVAAPEKPKPPVPKPPVPLTLQTVLGEHLMEHNIPESQKISDEEFNKLIFGKSEFNIDDHERQIKEDELLKDLTNPYKKLQNNNIKSGKSKRSEKSVSEENTQQNTLNNNLPFPSSSGYTGSVTQSSLDHHPSIAPVISDPLVSSKASIRSTLSDNKFDQLGDSNRSDYSSATFNAYNPDEPTYYPHNDPRLPPLDLSLLNHPNTTGSGQPWSTAASVSSVAMDPPPRRRSFLNLSSNMVRSSFLKNFRRSNGSNDSADPGVVPRSGSGTSHHNSLHEYTRALSQTTQHFLSAIAKQFNRSVDQTNANTNNNSDNGTNQNDPFILPSDDFYQPKYYILNEGNDFGDDESFVSPPIEKQQDYKLDKMEQPLSNPNQEFIYQYSTNSYVPKDYVNHSSYGFYHRGHIPTEKDYQHQDIYFSERHLEKIENTTAGVCDPVIYLPPNYSKKGGDDHYDGMSESHQMSKHGETGDENSSIHSHNILKVYSRNPSHQSLASAHLQQQQQQQSLRNSSFDAEEEDQNEEEENRRTAHVISPSHVITAEVTTSPNNDNKDDANYTSSKKTLFPVASNLDLRDEIAQFMNKTNSPLKQDYGQYVEKTMVKPSLLTNSLDSFTADGSIAGGGSVISQDNFSTKRSVASDSLSVTPDEAHQKLWEKLHSRYSGDREGQYHTKIKVAQYLKEGVKEETQIMKKYLEEIEEW